MTAYQDWQDIIHKGRVTSTYKYALAESLLQASSENITTLSLTKLTTYFAPHLCRHVAQAPRQITNPTNQVFETCKAYNQGNIEYSSLLETVEKYGYNWVLEAFHKVNGIYVETNFFTLANKNSVITLTPALQDLIKKYGLDNLLAQVENRWQEIENRWNKK